MTSEIRFKCDLCKVSISKEYEDDALTIFETEGCLRKNIKGCDVNGSQICGDCQDFICAENMTQSEKQLRDRIENQRETIQELRQKGTASAEPHLRLLELFDELPLGHCQRGHWLKKYGVNDVIKLTNEQADQLVTELEALLHEKTNSEASLFREGDHERIRELISSLELSDNETSHLLEAYGNKTVGELSSSESISLLEVLRERLRNQALSSGEQWVRDITKG